MSVTCLHCAGWGCTRCAYERAEAAGGEQGPTAEELELQQLRDKVSTLKSALTSLRKKAFEYRVSQGRHMPPSWSQHFEEIEAEAAAALGEKPTEYLYGVLHAPRGGA